MSTPTFQRETNDFVPLAITRAGQPYTGGFDTCIVTWGRRPLTFIPAITVNGKKGFTIAGLSKGTYQLYYRPTGLAPYAPVPDPIEFRVA